MLQNVKIPNQIRIKKSHLFLGLIGIFLCTALGFFTIKNTTLASSLPVTKNPASPAQKNNVLAYTTCNIKPYDFFDMQAAGPYSANNEGVYAFARCCVVSGYSQPACQALGRYDAAHPYCFGPERNLKRAEMAYLVARYHVQIRGDWAPAPPGTNYFKDVLPADWPGGQYELIQASKYNEFFQGLYIPPTDSINCNARGSDGKFQSYSNPSASPCMFDPNGDWIFGFHGIDRYENYNGQYNFANSAYPIPYPSGQPRAQFIQELYDYFKAKDLGRPGSELGACLGTANAACTITAPISSCNYSSPATNCNISLSWTSQYGSNIQVKDAFGNLVEASNSWNNYQIGITAGSHTYTCYNGATPLSNVTVQATSIPPPLPPTYEIRGRVFNDMSKNARFDLAPDDETWKQAFTIGVAPLLPGMSVLTDATNGTYRILGVPARAFPQNYTVSFTRPSGYSPTLPNTPSQFYAVNVGTGGSCAFPANALSASCAANGDLANLNFGFTNSTAWTQYVGLNVRSDSGFSSTVPTAVDSSCQDPQVAGDPVRKTKGYSAVTGPGGTHGVIFSGPTRGDFTPPGSASVNNWNVFGADASFSPDRGQITLAYKALRKLVDSSGQLTSPVPANCSTNCTLGKGVYVAATGITLGNIIVNDVPVIILVDGAIILTGTTKVGTKGFLLIASTDDILVDKAMGVSSYSCTVTPANTELQGIFSTHGSFIIGNNPGGCPANTPDKMLRIDGTVITNAALGTDPLHLGGTFVNDRDLCGGNLRFPTVRIRQRPEFIINAPEFIKPVKTFFQELAP